MNVKISIGSSIFSKMSLWPKELAVWLFDKFKHKSDILDCPEAELPNFLKKKLISVPFDGFVHGLTVSTPEEE
jgi:hypothetical protein